MLTKDLAKIRLREGKAFPSFLGQDHAKVRDTAAAMIELGKKMTQSTIEEFTEALQSEVDTTLPYYKGLLKVYLGENEGELPNNFADARRRFLEISENIRKQAGGDLLKFKTLIEQECQESCNDISKKIYGDLPEFAILTPPDTITPDVLIGQYNRALLKGVLITAKYLKVDLPIKGKETTAELRKILRAAKFHRLIVEKIEEKSSDIKSSDKKSEKEKTSSLIVSGPLSLSSSGVSYGIRLAAFVEHVIDLPVWRIEAEITSKAASLRLEQDSSKAFFGVKSTATPHIPDEYSALLGKHEIKGQTLEITIPTDIIPIAGVPTIADFQVVMGRQKLFLEIFHKWHQGSLIRRLHDPSELLAKDFFLAVDKSLIKNEELSKAIELAKIRNVPILEFRDFPTLKAIVEVFGSLPKYNSLKPPQGIAEDLV